MSDKKLNTTTLVRVDMYGVEYTISATGTPGSSAVRYAQDDARDSMIASLAEMVAPLVAAHAFPETTRKDVADVMFPYSEEWQEVRDVQNQLQKSVEDIQSAVHIANVEDAYREYAIREYLDELPFDRAVRAKIIRLLTTKQQDTVPPAA